VQAQIMALLGDLGREGGMALLLISHDLGVVAEVADEVAVMYAGRIVEAGPAAKVLDAPSHPYTRGLVRSMPSLERPREQLAGIDGSPPDLANIPPGCPFHPRCPEVIDVCTTTLPELRTLEPERRAACHVAERVLHG
jgi:oligopeptide/dipeptide ABC transporter ATP-binding protein